MDAWVWIVFLLLVIPVIAALWYSGADALVQEVMKECGYPMESFEQREADIPVDHPDVTQGYRAAHAISLANDHGKASTQDLRAAMIHYRSLFGNLLAPEAGFRKAP